MKKGGSVSLLRILVTILGEQSRNKARERFLRSALLHLRQRRLGLREPERHLHA